MEASEGKGREKEGRGMKGRRGGKEKEGKGFIPALIFSHFKLCFSS